MTATEFNPQRVSKWTYDAIHNWLMTRPEPDKVYTKPGGNDCAVIDGRVKFRNPYFYARRGPFGEEYPENGRDSAGLVLGTEHGKWDDYGPVEDYAEPWPADLLEPSPYE